MVGRGPLRRRIINDSTLRLLRRKTVGRLVMSRSGFKSLRHGPGGGAATGTQGFQPPLSSIPYSTCLHPWLHKLVENALGGWPFGLESLTFRLRNMECLQAPTIATNSLNRHSDSFPSYSSSELDTISTKSFFQDHSITLGTLIGMTPVDRNVRFAKSFLHEELEYAAIKSLTCDSAEEHDEEMVSCCVCAPFVENVLPGKNSSR
ncbi:uncharacterized protein LOC122010375 isoform X1 [Zingiber officinale]|uniref:uncharacterized protein LOC122010375 isoform X1 n=1 Tax=Zingiber officinale TaxID=94328 RepID=UPI001C4CEA0B|nr:uncharacterized protein LOC122010375 isoform X1 [Zingiber officinale]